MMTPRDQTRKQRFQRDAPSLRLANIASELRRIGARARAGHADQALLRHLTLVATLMDWSADAATTELADMQRGICRWRHVSPLGPSRSILALRAEAMSERLLKQSGLAG